jgi:N-methylhydantoinase A
VGHYFLSTDTGGTFVDAVIWDVDRGCYCIGKAQSKPEDPAGSIVAAIRAAAEIGGIPPDQVLKEAKLLCNGTTVTTNAMIERRGSVTGLLITAGFEDTLSIANVLGRTVGLDEEALLDYRRAEWPEPIVRRTHVRGVVERVDARGQVVVPLDEKQALEAISALVSDGVEALAICLLWSFRRPEHEQRLKVLVERDYPDLFVVTSSELIPVLREYERANTTAINAYLGRVFKRYASGMRDRLRGEGYTAEPLVMQSIGGLAPSSEVERIPITTLFSGPVGGVIAGRNLGAAIGRPNVITTDMGGTSFDVGLVLEGEPLTKQTTVIERQMIALPTVDIVTVGAGGGSIAWINRAGILQVGPGSMGAVPGPACYDRGGTTPTVTDADVVLGYISPEHFLGGRMPISRAKAEEAIRTGVADPIGMSVVEAAAAIYEIVNARMADLIRRMTVERGHDPRDFVMVAFGGCGPTHSTAFGRDIGVRTVIVPNSATAFSALGIAESDFKHSFVRSFPNTLRRAEGALEISALDELNSALKDLHDRAFEQLDREKVDIRERRIAWSAELRYKNQVHELLVPLSLPLPLDSEGLAEVVRHFQLHYEKRYGAGSSSPTARIDWVALRVDAIAPTSPGIRPRPLPIGPSNPAEALIGQGPVYRWSRRQHEQTPLFSAEKLTPGNCLTGPAVVLSYGMTIPLHDGQRLRVDEYRNFTIEFEQPHQR